MVELKDCSSEASRAYDVFTRRGLNSAQAAGIIGNLQFESSLNPRLEVMDTNGRLSRGIAMWQPPRWQNLLTFAAGRDPWSLDIQLEFLLYELEAYPELGLRDLLSATSVSEAAVAFQNKFERCDPMLCHTDRRISLANNALSCLSVSPPTGSARLNVVGASIGLLSLVAAAGYGAYKALDFR